MKKAAWLFWVVALVVIVFAITHWRSPTPAEPLSTAAPDAPAPPLSDVVDSVPPAQPVVPEEDEHDDVEPNPAGVGRVIATPASPSAPATPVETGVMSGIAAIESPAVPPIASDAGEVVEPSQSTTMGGIASRPVNGRPQVETMDRATSAPSVNAGEASSGDAGVNEATSVAIEANGPDAIDPPRLTRAPPTPMPVIPPGAVHIGRGSPGWSQQAMQQRAREAQIMPPPPAP